jgi:hypothetical protein
MTLATMSNNLLRFVPGLSPDLIKSTLQDSYKQLTSRDWARLKLQRQIYTTATYSTGTVSVDTTGVVTGVGTTFTSAMVGRFMRIEYTDSLFEIDSYASGISVTLKDWTGVAVAAGHSYTILKVIYPVDTLFGVVYEVEYQTSLRKKSQRYFNQIDPSRTTTGTPTYWAYAGMTSAGVIQIEIYPVPTTVIPLRIYGKRRASTLGDSDTPWVQEDLIETHALINCYELKDLQNPKEGWGQKAVKQVQLYTELLERYETEDYQLDAHSDKVKDRMGGGDFPLDDNFAVSHDVEW